MVRASKPKQSNNYTIMFFVKVEALVSTFLMVKIKGI